jgi:hypothetical protein
MQWDTISDQWFWLSAAAVFVVFVGAFAGYSFYKKPKLRNETKPYTAVQNGWMPTGRIDFVDPRSIGDFILQVEKTRIVDSMGGVEHREIRWRKATLDEAKAVLVSYHVQRNLTMTANFIVTSSNVMRQTSDLGNERQETQLKKNGASDAQSNGDAKRAGDATSLAPDASPLTNPA